MINENLYYQIELTARKIRQYGQTVLRDHGIDITVEQWLVLKVVAENEGINLLRVSEILYKDKPTISRMVKFLEQKELLNKTSSETDLRELSLHLTLKGKEWIKHFYPVVEQIRLKGLDTLSATEKDQVRDLLEKIRNNLD